MLEEIGIEFREFPRALDLWRDAGADVEGERVRFPRGLCRSIIQASAPAEFTQHARNPERNVIIGGDRTVFVPAYGPPFVRDLDQGRRYATLEDFENFVKLTYMSPGLHHSGGTLCEPVNLPVNKRHFDMVYSHVKYSDKPFMGSVTAPERAQDTIEMVKLLFGDEFVDQNTVVTALINANSPLTYDGTMLGAATVYAEHNQATIVSPFLLAGAMSPVTVAGTVTQILAEALAGMAYVQLVRPGAPVVFGTFAAAVSMQSGAPPFGPPEPSLILYATAALSYEKFILDAGQASILGVMLRGVDMSENGQALDALHEVGPGAHFLGASHTQANFERAFYRSTVADNNSFEQWEQDGSLDAPQRAHAIWKQMLNEYEAPPLDAAIDEALIDYVNRRKSEFEDRDH